MIVWIQTAGVQIQYSQSYIKKIVQWSQEENSRLVWRYTKEYRHENGWLRRTVLCRFQANIGLSSYKGKLCYMGRTGEFSQTPDLGFCISQNACYLGYTLHALCWFSEVVHPYDLSKASVADLNLHKICKAGLSRLQHLGRLGIYRSWCTTWPVRNRTYKTGMPVSAQPE